MDHIDDEDRRDAGIVRLLTDVGRAVRRLAALLWLAMLYLVAPAALFAWGRATGASGTAGRGTTSGRRFPAHVATRWAVTWGASLALFVTVRTIRRAPFVGLLHWAATLTNAPPAHPTFAQTLAALPATVALMLLPLVVLAVLAGPVLVPLIAAGHIVVSWRRGGER
jgi:hypothetical protein